MKKHVLTLLVLAALPAWAQTTYRPAIDTALQETNSSVLAIAKAGNTLYVGGQFTHVGRSTGGAVRVDDNTGALVSTPYKIDGILTSVSDDAGGWYVGGNLVSPALPAGQKLAHIRADNSIDMGWLPQANDSVKALLKVGNRVYVGGAFSQINGQAQHGLAALDATTGQTIAWGSGVTGTVAALAFGQNAVFVGGQFSQVGGVSRNHIGAINASTGQTLTWNPDADEPVLSLAVSGQTVYAGGLFQIIGGQSRKVLAALDVNTGLATSWAPLVTSINSSFYGLEVAAIAVVGRTIYVGGSFTAIDNVGASNVAAIDSATGQANRWYTNINEHVSTLCVHGGKLYVGGKFDQVNSQRRLHAASLDINTGVLTGWDPGANDEVRTLAPSANSLFMGGNFTIASGLRRPNLAAIDLATGQATAWAPRIGGRYDLDVRAIAIKGNTLYVGGKFDTVSGQLRRNLAALDINTGQLLPWNPSPNEAVNALTVQGDTLYVGGEFDSVSAVLRPTVAAINTVTGALTSWNPGQGLWLGFNYVSAIAAKGRQVVLGGRFDQMGGANRQSLAVVNAQTGHATTFNANVRNAGGIRSVAIKDNQLYVAGWFSIGGSQPRNDLAVLNLVTGVPTNWNPVYIGTPYAMAMTSNMTYIGGDGFQLPGQNRRNVVAIDSAGQTTGWDPDIKEDVYAMAAYGDTVYAGGNFRTVSGQLRSGLVAMAAHTVTSVAERQSRQPFRLYPNPAQGVVHVAFPGNVSGAITVTNTLGQAVLSTTATQQLDLDVSRLSRGVYYLSATGYAAQMLVVE